MLNNKICVSIDKTTDIEGRYVFNVNGTLLTEETRGTFFTCIRSTGKKPTTRQLVNYLIKLFFLYCQMELSKEVTII